MTITQFFNEVFLLRDFFDVLLVTFLVYLVIVLLKRTHSSFIVGGVGILAAIYGVARFFNFSLTTYIFQYFLGFLIVILAVVFQRELRSFFEWIFVLGIFSRKRVSSLSETTSQEIINSLEYLAQHKIGALIAVVGRQPIDRFLMGGFELYGQISKSLLLSIFDPSSPGHDGAVVIEGDRIQKFATHLPLAEKFNQYKELGTRHRSGLGLSAVTDALVMIVSEERGTITLARNGKLTIVNDTKELEQMIREFLAEGETSNRPWRDWVTQNIPEKILALGVALILWFVYVYQLGAGHR